MSDQANILLFEEMRRAAGAKRPSVSSASKAPRSRPSVTSSSSTVHAEQGSRAHHDAAAHAPRSFSQRRGRADASTRTVAHREEAGRDARRDREEATEEDRAVEKGPSRFDAFRRKRSKDKADRAFDRQFGGAGVSSDSSDQAPRAAVYKGEMGASHRRATRMQDGDLARGSAQNRPESGFLSSLRSSRKLTGGAIVLACLVLACLFLYPAAQQYYHASRENDRLQAEYEAIEQRNAVMQSEVDSLKTDSGVKARAHEQFGWVEEGEQSAVVHGLDADDEDADVLADVSPDSVSTPETWYSPVLDALFGVE